MTRRPPPADAAQRGRATRTALAAGRREDYAELRAAGLTQAQAAARLGVTERHARRYEKALRTVGDDRAEVTR
jgi:hypothetical protein